MRFLFPAEAAGATGDVDLETAYALPTPVLGEPHVRVSFVVSVDGACEVGGRSGPLGSEADRKVLQTLRRLADVIVVGAGTVRAEGYGGVQVRTYGQDGGAGTDAGADAGAGARGAPAPVVAIVSRRLDLDVRLPVFTENAVRPLILTGTAAPADRRKSLEAVADVVVLEDDEVGPADVVATLAERGFQRVLCEGGPTVYSAFAADGLADELCINISPLLAGPAHSRIVSGREWAGTRPLTLVHVLEHEGMLFLRYRS